MFNAKHQLDVTQALTQGSWYCTPFGETFSKIPHQQTIFIKIIWSCFSVYSIFCFYLLIC